MQLKKRIIAAAIIAFLTLGIYPVIDFFATIERGRDAFGGEELIIIFGLAIAAMVLVDGTEKKRGAARPKANRPTTESEQSNNHFDA